MVLLSKIIIAGKTVNLETGEMRGQVKYKNLNFRRFKCARPFWISCTQKCPRGLCVGSAPRTSLAKQTHKTPA
jgi:hypothetical protein